MQEDQGFTLPVLDQPRPRRDTAQRKDDEFNSVVNDILGDDGEHDELAILAGVGGDLKLPSIVNRSVYDDKNDNEQQKSAEKPL